MHIHTHFMSGWCGANLVELNKRERFFGILAATLPDWDGFGMLLGKPELYVKYHHVLGHNLTFGLILCSFFAFFSSKRITHFLIYLALFHLHLILDLLGSGSGWGVAYLWPFSAEMIYNPYIWGLDSWQSMSFILFFFIWLMVILHKKKRTPFEYFIPPLDRKIVQFIERVEENTRKATEEKASKE